MKELSKAMLEYAPEKVVKYVKIGLKEGLDPLEMIEKLTQIIRIVGDRFARGEAFLVELMMAGEAMKAGIELLKPKIMEKKLEKKSLGRVVMGTVKGDIHDIGKNIVTIMLEVAGFEVFDLGVDVPAETFVERVRETSADIIGMSALLTTTVPEQKVVVEALRKAGIREKVKVIVGGAATTPEWAKEIEADGYADNALEAVELVKKLLMRNDK